MTRHHNASAQSAAAHLQPATADTALDAPFVDGLSGFRGMADPPDTTPISEVFPDALVAPTAVDAPRIDLPDIEVPRIEMPTPAQIAASLSGEHSERAEPPRDASPKDRALAAREAMAARVGVPASSVTRAAWSPGAAEHSVGMRPMQQMPTRTLRVPAGQQRRHSTSSSALVSLLIFVIFLVISGFGSQLLGALTDLIGQ